MERAIDASYSDKCVREDTFGLERRKGNLEHAVSVPRGGSQRRSRPRTKQYGCLSTFAKQPDTFTR